MWGKNRRVGEKYSEDTAELSSLCTRTTAQKRIESKNATSTKCEGWRFGWMYRKVGLNGWLTLRPLRRQHDQPPEDKRLFCDAAAVSNNDMIGFDDAVGRLVIAGEFVMMCDMCECNFEFTIKRIWSHMTQTDTNCGTCTLFKLASDVDLAYVG